MTTLKILLDATCVNRDATTGAGRYVLSLLRSLASLGDEFSIHVFTFSPEALGSQPRDVRVTGLELSKTLGPVARETARTRFVVRSARDGYDLVHYTLDPAPPTKGLRSVLTLFDLARRAPSFRNATGASLRAFVRTQLRYGLARRMDMLITTTPFAATEIARDLPCPPDKIRVSPIAADPIFHVGEMDESTLATHRLRAKQYILFVGQLGRQKNEDGLIEAFQTARRRNLLPPRTELVLAGDLSQARPETLAACAADTNIRLLGVVTDPDLVHLYRAASCVALPSFTEGYGLPIQEAMACGTPTLISRGTCLADIAGDAALDVNPESVGEMSDALGRLTSDADLRARLSRRGLERLPSRNDSAMARAHLEAYRDALQ